MLAARVTLGDTLSAYRPRLGTIRARPSQDGVDEAGGAETHSAYSPCLRVWASSAHSKNPVQHSSPSPRALSQSKTRMHRLRSALRRNWPRSGSNWWGPEHCWKTGRPE